MTQNVPNPFFGNPNAGSYASRATLPRNQLLRPFPQFDTVNMAESNHGKSQYHAGVIQIRKRMTWWSGSFSYTCSRLWDNQFGQGNYYTSAPGLLNSYTFDEQSPYFDPDSEYSRSLLDSPHKLSITPIVQLPFGEGRRFLDGGGISNLLFGNWTISAVIQMQSGFPIGVSQSTNTNAYMLGANQRPNIVEGQPFVLSDITARLRRDPNDDRYLNVDAFTNAPAGTFGNAPRTLPGAYSPWRNSTDLAINKDIRFGGDKRATLRLEVINLFDNPWYASMASTAFGNVANFGRVDEQGNYSRTMQITGRFSF